MSKFAFAVRSSIRVVALSSSFLGLAACGMDGDSTLPVTTQSVVSSNAGTIDRATDTTASTIPQTASLAGPSTSNTSAATPASSTAGTGSTVVAVNTPPSTVGGSSGSTGSGGGTGGAGTGGTGSGGNGPNTTTGSTTLDWIPPTRNSDGTALTNLAGYIVYYGTSPTNLNRSVKITNPGLTAYTVTNLASGKWYFAITSVSSSGVESARTSTLSATI